MPFLGLGEGRRAPRRKPDMRLPAFAVLACLASGCTIHVVEQAAAPVMLADAPPPAPVRPWRPRSVVACAPAPGPATYAPTSPALVAPPRRVQRPELTRPTPRPSRTPFKTLAPEARSPYLASSAPPIKHRRPQKVKQDEPVTRVTLTRVAKAQ